MTYLSLDHDLGDDNVIGTGYDVLKWLEEKVTANRYFVPPNIMTIHSASVSARKKMDQVIESIQTQHSMNVMWVLEMNS